MLASAVMLGVMLGACAADGDEFTGLDAEAWAELKRCPELPSSAEVVPPPGTYADQGIALDWDKLVPRPDPRVGLDAAYFAAVRDDPRRTEQVYHDATHGNRRAAWMVCQTEAGLGAVGRDAARYLASLGCATLYQCRVRFDKLPFSDTTASGRRMLAIIAGEFEAKALELQLAKQLVGDALMLFTGARIAGVVRAGPRVRSVGSTPRPRPRSVARGSSAVEMADGTTIRLPRSLGAAAKRIPVKNGGHLSGSTITRVEQIARGREIREVGRLVKTYGGRPASWRKMKGTASVETPSGTIRRAEVH